jgi:transcriptional regulator with XRE-family HTH domain
VALVRKQPENADSRVKRRILERLQADKDLPRPLRKNQRALAKAAGISEQAISELLDATPTQGLLVHLDQIARYLEMPPSLLVHANDTTMVELETHEYRLVDHWRSFPLDIQERLLGVIEYFSGVVTKEQREQRRFWMKLRRLSAPDRATIEQTVDGLLRATRAAKDTDTAPAAPTSSPATMPASGAPRARRG